MENTINRKEYRRNVVHEGFEKVEKEKVKPKESLLLNKIINAMLLLLTILLVKLFNYNEVFYFIKEKFNSGISYETLAEDFKQKINLKLNSYIESGDIIKKSGENIFISGDNNQIKEDISGDVYSGEQGYIEAVAGVNQFMEDSNEIKEKYKLQNPLKGTITSSFGCRVSNNPIVSSYHTGLDIAANTGTIIVAAHEGKIIQAGISGSYGKCITIENGDLKTLYAHCNELLVKEGDLVKAGQSIAKVGMTGNATGPHLHLEVRYDGRLVNPEDVI